MGVHSCRQLFWGGVPPFFWHMSLEEEEEGEGAIKPSGDGHRIWCSAGQAGV